MTDETTPNTVNARQICRTIAGFFCLSLGLCIIFAGGVTAVQAWQEHAQAQWPQATAHVERCELEETSSGEREMYYIDCRVSYAVGAEQRTKRLYSSNVPSRNVWQYPPNQIGPFEDWIVNHPQGTPIIVNYDPANHSKAVLLNSDMPGAGPHTPHNLKLLEGAAAAFLLMLALMQVLR